ncbi:Ku protein [Flavobacterium urumqiense]|uniref:Non-homologous end joining protein Ku n=1 Tax=Flavobacterium urumqiense TaxID=935224 RepID=A0A1H5ZI12_9FLAO|nr:Ku protein [Flavobacterium urumqiense]SEG36089.1 DNA end-binding protein Ku [Flavobacterium urumqiense]
METRIKSIWTGSITFGLINIPIKVFSAVKESNIEMNMLDKNDYSNIKFKRVNENTGKEVDYADIVKGYKRDDRYVVIEEADFEAAAAEKTKNIEIMNFVDEKEIDTIYYEQPYYLEPDKGALNAYALLRDALQTSAKVGVGTIVLRNKESLVILKSYKNVIVLNRIRFQEEIRNITELKLPPLSAMNSKEMDMAVKLVEQLTEKFDVAKYKDNYTAKLLEIIKDKAKGKKQVAPKLKVVHKQNDDLMAMLKASLESEKDKSS